MEYRSDLPLFATVETRAIIRRLIRAFAGEMSLLPTSGLKIKPLESSWEMARFKYRGLIDKHATAVTVLLIATLFIAAVTTITTMIIGLESIRTADFLWCSWCTPPFHHKFQLAT